MAVDAPARKRPGHPPLVDGDTTTPLTVRVSTRQYDALCARAMRDGLSLADVIRRELHRATEDEGSS